MQIWHNPRCSKSRQTLSLIQEAGVEPEIVLYLDNPPTEGELTAVLKMLGMRPRDLIRRGESDYKTLDLADKSLTDEQIVAAMCKHPILIERPVVIDNGRSIVGRPPENVLDLLG